MEARERKKATGLGQTPVEKSDKLSDKDRARVKLYPLFQLKVPPRLGGPPISPGPYAPAYPAFPDATPLIPTKANPDPHNGEVKQNVFNKTSVHSVHSQIMCLNIWQK